MANECALFLDRNGLENVKSLLLEHDIDTIGALQGCTEENFKEIGLKIGSIGKIRTGLQELKGTTTASYSADVAKASAPRKRIRSKCSGSVRQHPRIDDSLIGLPEHCLITVLEYAYVGTTDSIEMTLYVDGFRVNDSWFSEVLSCSKVPQPLRGHVLGDGRAFLCTGQIPIFNASRGLMRSLDTTWEAATDNEICGLYIFREYRKRLQMRPVYEDAIEQDTKRGFTECPHRWKTIGAVLGGPHPLACLSRNLSRHLCGIAPCNFRYIVDRHSEIEGRCEFGDHPGSDLVFSLEGTASESLSDTE